MTKKKSKIKCDVESCVHQNNDEKVCELDEIKVSSGEECNEDEVVENEQTVCESFDCDESFVEEQNDDNEEEYEEDTDDDSDEEYEEYEKEEE